MKKKVFSVITGVSFILLVGFSIANHKSNESSISLDNLSNLAMAGGETTYIYCKGHTGICVEGATVKGVEYDRQTK